MNESIINKELVFNYFSGRSTAFEKEVIDEWSRNVKGEEQLFIWLLEWENQNLQYQADVDKAISRQKLQMADATEGNSSNDEETQVFGPAGSFFRKRNFWLVAAAVALIVTSTGWFFQDNIRFEIYTTSFGQNERIELEDGSKVVLNANSTLRVPRFNFGEVTRDVYMSGEANFSVMHTKDHKKFIVHTNQNLDIEVLGTEFNIYARKRGAQVVLSKGKVKLHYLEGNAIKQIVMKPGDLVTMDEKGRAVIAKTENPTKYSAWKAHRFIFENESLRKICNLFEDNFGLTVHIPDSSLADQTISGSFTALNAEELLEILTDDSGLSYTKSEDGKVITLGY
jgi:transmembrane sensor